MSKEVTQRSLGCSIVVKGVPTTAAEFDEMAGETGACVDEAISNVILRGWLNRWRAAVINDLVEKTGIPRLTEGEGDNAIITEKDTTYMARLRKSEGIGEDVIGAVAQQCADNMPFAINVTSARVGKRFLESADDVIAKVNSQRDGDFSTFITNITNSNPGFNFAFDGDGAPTRESVAYALKTNEERVIREGNNSLV